MIELKVNSEIYGGWQEVRIPFGLEQIANSFELSVTDKWTGQSNPRPIKRFAKCQVLIDGEVIITGYVDSNTPEFDTKNHSINITGRDATGDLVDCSAIHKSGQWSGTTLDKIVRDICQPFSIPVNVNVSMGPAFSTFSIQEGETAFEAIDRACRMRAVMPISDGLGGLLLTRAKAGTPIAELTEGVNILHGRGEFDAKERFSQYHIKGQDRGNDDDWDSPESHTQVSAKATDDLVPRYRPLIVIAEEKGPHATYKDRAQWERNVRRARSSRGTIRVNGWRNVTGRLWRANTLAHLQSPMLDANANVLIAGGTYIISKKSGTVTELSVVGQDAFDLTSGNAEAEWSGF